MILTKDSEINYTGFLDDLRELGFIYIDIEELKQPLKLLEQRIYTLQYLCSQIMAHKSCYMYKILNTQNIVNYLIQVEGCPPNAFKTKNVSGQSLDSSKVLTPLFNRGYAKEFLSLYMELTSTKSIKGLVKGLIDKSKESDKISEDGRPLRKITFNLREAPNMRAYYYDHGIQNIPKTALKSLKAPKGYTLVSGDFAQSDVRVAYSLLLKSKDNIGIMQSSDDIYQVFARMFMGNDFDPEHFKEFRNSEYKPNTLGPLYGATRGNSEFSSRFINNANEYLKTQSHYMEFSNRLDKHIRLGFPIIINTYFGNEEVVEIPSYIRHTPTDLKNKALNCPIQTGTAEVVIATQQKIMSEFAKLGITPQNEGIYSYMTRHDELVFLIKDEYLKYANIFAQCENIFIENWIPLKIEFEYSKTYGIPDSDIKSVVELYYDHNTINKEFKECKDLNTDDFFIPIDDILEVTVGVAKDNYGNSFVSFYDEYNQKVSIEFVATQNMDEILMFVVNKISTNKNKLFSQSIRNVMVNTILPFNNESVFNGILIKFTDKFSSSLASKAQMLSEYGMKCYYEQKGIPVDVEDSVINNKAFLESVLQNEELFD